MGTSNPRLTGNVNSKHSKRNTAQRAKPKNPGSENKRNKTDRQRDQTPRQGLGHHPTPEPVTSPCGGFNRS